MFIGFNVKLHGGQSVSVIDWKHQPFGRGRDARPIAEDSATVTVQIAPRPGPNTPPLVQGVYLEDFYANILWSAAGIATQMAQVDLQRGSAFTLVATAVRVEAVAKYSGPSQFVYELNATIGRGTRASTHDQPTRTIRAGVLDPAAVSPQLEIPAYARSITVTSATATGLSGATITQYSNGVPVQVDQVTTPRDLVIVAATADSFTLTNLALVPTDLSAVFRIGL